MTKQIASYGTWKSPITAELATARSPIYSQIRLGSAKIYWLISDGSSQYIASNTNERIPAEGNVRSEVHEYGGGDFTVYPEDGYDTIYYINSKNQQWYCVDSRNPINARQITTNTDDNVQTYYSNAVVSHHGKWLICIREEHIKIPHEVINTLVAVNTTTGQVNVLAAGNDFYSSPAINQEGTQIAWLSWNHPQMPWDGTVLNTALFAETGGIIEAITSVAGGPHESIFQPSYSPQGELHFVSDRTHGWWQIYRFRNSVIEPVLAEFIQGEFGVAAWALGSNTYAFLPNGDIVARYNIFDEHTHAHYLGVISQGKLTSFRLPYHQFGTSFVVTPGEQIYCIAGNSTTPVGVISFNLTQPEFITNYTTNEHGALTHYFSKPQFIQFTTGEGDEAHKVYAYYYPAHNPDYEAQVSEKPPLIIVCHGGPTSRATTELKLAIQFWTSQGYAVVDVDYSGSIGYGRGYRDSLKGKWGILDITDCLAAAIHLADQGLVDGNKVSIRGGSAGGYVVFSALAFHNVCAAGVSLYGIADLKTLASGTHKFESRYIDSLVAPLTPETEALYHQRSPINFVHQFACPVFILQGDKDQVVPVNQAIDIAKTLNDAKKAYALKIYPDEKHGFRSPAVKCDALLSEVDFLRQCYGLPRNLNPLVEIHHLQPKRNVPSFARSDLTLFVDKQTVKTEGECENASTTTPVSL